MMVTDEKKVFRNFAHKEIRDLVRYGQSHFKVQDFDIRNKYNIVEDYHFVLNNASLDVYCIAHNDTQGKYKSIDMHYHTSVGESSIKMQETNTEFAKQIYNKIREKHVRQHVK